MTSTKFEVFICLIAIAILSPIKITQISFLSPLPLSYQAIENIFLSFKSNIQIIESLSELEVVK